MRKSDIGPLGVVTLVFNVLIQVAALAHAESVSPGRGLAAVLVAAVTGRLAMTWACRTGVPAARPGGLGAMVAGTVRPVVPSLETVVVLAAAVFAVLVSGFLAWTLPVAVLAALAVAFALERHAVRRLGGITGDVLGAIAEVATTVALVVATMGPVR
jgi:adenosylcobinamide-GDP ribazoletransferase